MTIHIASNCYSSGYLCLDGGLQMVDIGCRLVRIGERFLMKMFLGDYSPNVTEGSRIALPKKLRDQIRGDEVVLSRGFDTCIFIYDKEDWETKAQKQVDGFLMGSVRTSDLERYLYTSAVEASIDGQGRLVIPANLKDYAHIDKNTAVIGVGDHIEVWDKATWDAHLQKISEELSA